MSKKHYNQPTPIDQAEVIPISERAKLYQEIQKALFILERIKPRGPQKIKQFIDLEIKYAREEKEEKENAVIIPFKREVAP